MDHGEEQTYFSFFGKEKLLFLCYSFIIMLLCRLTVVKRTLKIETSLIIAPQGLRTHLITMMLLFS